MFNKTYHFHFLSQDSKTTVAWVFDSNFLKVLKNKNVKSVEQILSQKVVSARHQLKFSKILILSFCTWVKMSSLRQRKTHTCACARVIKLTFTTFDSKCVELRLQWLQVCGLIKNRWHFYQTVRELRQGCRAPAATAVPKSIITHFWAKVYSLRLRED